MYQRSRPPQHVEADLVYFADERRDLGDSEPLVLVECKRPAKDPAAATGQVRSCALWVLPAYYVITDAQTLTVYDLQGAIAPDIQVLEVKQDELAGKFDDLYSRLNPQAAASARRQKIAKITPLPGEHHDRCRTVGYSAGGRD